MSGGRPGAASLARMVGLALLWGSSFLWIAIALRGFNPAQIVLVRLNLGALVLLAVLYLVRQRLPSSARTWQHLLVAALLGNVVPYLLFAVGQQTVSSALAGSLNATTPLWAFGFGLVLGTERGAGSMRLGGLALGLAGAVLILEPWQGASGELAGSVACLAAAASYGLSYVYMGRYLARLDHHPLVLPAAQLIAASGLSILIVPVIGTDPISLSASVLAAVTILGVVGTGAAYVLNYRLITDEGPTYASTVTYLLPAVAVSLGVIVLGDPLTPLLLVGTAIVVISIALVRRTTAGSKPQPSRTT